MKSITPLPIKYVLNSHYHADHTGANAAMLAKGLKSSRNAICGTKVINVERNRRPRPTRSCSAISGVYLGGVEVQMLYLGRAHTNGDTFVYFPDLKTVPHDERLVMWMGFQ